MGLCISLVGRSGPTGSRPWKGLLGMAAGKRHGPVQAPDPRDRRSPPTQTSGLPSKPRRGLERSASAPRQVQRSDARARAITPPAQGRCPCTPVGPRRVSRIVRALGTMGAGAKPLRRRGADHCLGVGTLRSPDGTHSRDGTSRETGCWTAARRSLAAMPSKTPVAACCRRRPILVPSKARQRRIRRCRLDDEHFVLHIGGREYRDTVLIKVLAPVN